MLCLQKTTNKLYKLLIQYHTNSVDPTTKEVHALTFERQLPLHLKKNLAKSTL